MAKFVYGIDLGTTYSCISYVDETGRATVIDNMEGTNTTPSVVNFENPMEVSVGQLAKENAVVDPENTVSFVKNLIGRTDYTIAYNGEDKSPEEISSYILRKVAGDAARQINQEVKDVVITCPAYFGSAETSATKKAGEIAGLNVLEIINEPTAAAIYYGCTKTHEDKTILIYDLGGGTFDVTVMDIKDGKIRVICTDGDLDLGGKNWDDALILYLQDEYKAQTGYDGEIDPYAQQELRIKAEKAKQQLTGRQETTVVWGVTGSAAKMTVTREIFEEITQSLLNRTLERTGDALRVAKDKGFEVSEILLVGGSSYMPQVPKALAERYGIEPRILEPNEAVAKGAAIYALQIYRPNPAEETPSVTPEVLGIAGKVEVIAATTKSYALQVLYNGESVCRNMIIKNEPMPEGQVSVTREFGTAEDNQRTADVVVYENDSMETYLPLDPDTVLGTVSIPLPSGLKAGSPLEVTFTLNREGILYVVGRDVVSGEIRDLSIKIAGVMDDQDVAALKQKTRDVVVQ